MSCQLEKTAFQLKRFNDRTLNRMIFLVSILVFGTGLILFTQFHIGGGAYQKEWLGFEKHFWLSIHQATAIVFLFGVVLHILAHRSYLGEVAKRWRHSLPGKIKSRTQLQILLLVVGIVVLWAGFYPWITMPDATLKTTVYHVWIDIHNRVGLAFLAGLFIHIAKRQRRIFSINEKNDIMQTKPLEGPEAEMKIPCKKKNAPRSRNKRTQYIIADTSKCEACWICIDKCKYDVLGKVDLWFHKHIVFKNGDNCRGCQKCVEACLNGVFTPIVRHKSLPVSSEPIKVL